MIKNRAIALGTVSFFVVLGGICTSVLLQFILNTLIDGSKEHSHSDIKFDSDNHEERDSDFDFAAKGSPLWLFGLVYIVPGILGIIAALVQNKCMYVVTIIFAIISLVLVGIYLGVFLLGLVILFLNASVARAVEDICYDTPMGCKCRDDEGRQLSVSGFKTCSYLSTFLSLATAVLAVCVVAWCLLLAEIILISYYLCCARTIQSRGVVLATAQQPMLASDYHQQQDKPAPSYYTQDPQYQVQGP